MEEHKRSVKNHNQNSMIYQHWEETGHNFDLEGAKPVHRNQNSGVREVLEGIYSHLDNKSINRHYSIPEQYVPMLNRVL